MEYTKIKNINEYVSESVSPMNTPEQIFEMYSVPIYSTGHPEYLHGNEIASNKVKVRKNDVLLCKINPRINRVWIVADESAYPCIASSEWIVIRNSEYNPEFLAWYFRSPKFKQLMTSEVTGIGGSLTRAQPKAVAEYPVPVIERQEQDVITEILNKIYNIIDARRREINILDDLIKARFVEMFGDPVSNEKGWTTRPLLDMGSCKNGMNFHYDDSGVEINCLGVGDFKDYSIIADTAALPTVSLNEMPSPEYLLRDDDIVFVRSNGNKKMVGRSVAVYPGAVPTTFSGFCIRYRREDNSVITPYLLRVLKAESMRQKMYGRGANIQNLNQQTLSSLDIPVPPKAMQEQFAAVVAQIDKSKVAVQKSLDETQLLFNSLMQKYFG